MGSILLLLLYIIYIYYYYWLTKPNVVIFLRAESKSKPTRGFSRPRPLIILWMKDEVTTFCRSKRFLRSNYQRGPWEWKPLLGLTLSLSSFSELTTSTTKWTQKLLQMLKNRRQAASSHPAAVCRASLLVRRVHRTGRGAWDLSTSPTMRNVLPWRREPRCGAGSSVLTEPWSLISQETVWNWNYTHQLLKNFLKKSQSQAQIRIFIYLC